MYAGAVLYGITNGLDWMTAGRLGSLASARLVTTLGARMQTADVSALLSEL
jgi:sugar/nucleoside kinase (ribokinase family)